MVVRFFVRVRVIRHQAEVSRFGGDSFEHADHPLSTGDREIQLTFYSTMWKAGLANRFPFWP
jgi:hypothetical protein